MGDWDPIYQYSPEQQSAKYYFDTMSRQQQKDFFNRNPQPAPAGTPAGDAYQAAQQSAPQPSTQQSYNPYEYDKQVFNMYQSINNPTIPQNTQAFNDAYTNLAKNSYRIPGGNPNIVVAPGSNPGAPTFYDMGTGRVVDANTLDRGTRDFGLLTSRYPGKIPTLFNTRLVGGGDFGNPNYSDEQNRIFSDIERGNLRNATALAQSITPMWRPRAPSRLKQFANRFYGPMLVSAPLALASGGIGAAYGPLWGAVAGGAGGAFSQGAQTRWKNPAATLAGAAGGAAGGWLGGQLGTTLGAGQIGTGALAGAGGSIGRDIGTGLATGQYNPTQMLRNAAISGAGSAAGAALTPTMPKGLNPAQQQAWRAQNILPNVAGNVAGSSAGNILNAFLPGAPTPPVRRPPAPQPVPLQRRRIPLNPYTR